MSYEHCEKHDCEATNGCNRCAFEELARLSFARTWAWEGGLLTIKRDGSLRFNVADNYYDGTIPRDGAIMIARAILQVTGLSDKGKAF